jgi:hypothetical protein
MYMNANVWVPHVSSAKLLNAMSCSVTFLLTLALTFALHGDGLGFAL